MVCAASPPQEADIDVLGLYCGAPEVIIVQLRSRKDGANIVRVEDKRPDSEQEEGNDIQHTDPARYTIRCHLRMLARGSRNVSLDESETFRDGGGARASY